MKHFLMDLLAAILALSGAGSAEEMGEEEMERYRHFAWHPLQINRLPAARLRASGIFTDYQLAAIEDYRARNGDILGPTEFALVDGIGPDAAEALVHFVSFEPAAYSGKGRLRQDLTVRGGVRDKDGTEWLTAAKYHLEAGRRAEFFWSSSRPYSAESFVPGTLSLALYGRGGASLVAGDFAARFGQGLALWSGFSMSGFSSVAAFRRNPTGFAPTGSFSPSLSGVAGEFSAGRWRFSAGVASPALRSFLAGKESSDRTLIPLAAATFLGRRGQFGVQGVWRNGAVVSADGVLGLGHWTLFGEAALSSRVVTEDGYGIRRTRVAALGGVSWAPAYRVKFALLGRYYPSGFYSPLAGAVRSYSSLVDKYGNALGEYGLSIGAGWRRAEFTADAAIRPGPGSTGSGLSAFGSGSRHFKTVLNLAPVIPAGRITLSPAARWTERYRPADANPWRHELRTDLTLSLPVSSRPVSSRPSARSASAPSSPSAPPSARDATTLSTSSSATPGSPSTVIPETPSSVILSKAKDPPAATLRATIRADIVRSKGWGRLFYAELGYVSEGFLSAYLRFTAFDIPEWADRIYCYERDLPGSFTVPAYYRRGRAISAVAGLKLPSSTPGLKLPSSVAGNPTSQHLPGSRTYRHSARHSINLRASLIRYPDGAKPPVAEVKLQYRIQL